MDIINEVLVDEYEILLKDEGYIKSILSKISFYSNKKAKELLKKVIDFAQSNSLKEAYAWGICNLGKIYLQEDNFKKADVLLSEAYNVFYTKKSSEGMLSAITGLMGSKCMQQQYDIAIQLGIEGTKLAEKNNNIERLIVIKINMGAIYIEIEEYEKALDILDQVEDITWIGEAENKVGYYINRAICKREIGDLDDALNNLQHVKEVSEDRPILKINWLIEMGKIHIKKECYKKAEEIFYQCLKLCDEYEAEDLTIEIILNLSEIDIIRENYMEVVSKLKNIEEDIEKVNVISYKKIMYRNLNLGYKGLKEYENAYMYLEKYTDIEKEIRNIQSATAISILDKQKEKMEENNYKLLYKQNNLLYTVGQNITSKLNQEKVFQVIADEINKVIEYDIIQIIVYNQEKDIFVSTNDNR